MNPLETRARPQISKLAVKVYQHAAQNVTNCKPRPTEYPAEEIEQFLSKINKKPPRDLLIFPDASHDVDRNDPRLVEFIAGHEEEYDKLLEKVLQNSAKPWRTAYELAHPVSVEAYLELQKLRPNFNMEVDRLRLHRKHSPNPHPKNVHIITSSSQYFVTSSPASNTDSTQKTAWNIRLMTNLLQSCSSMAKVIQKACSSNYIPEPCPQRIYIPPFIEKPVSSRGAQFAQGWKKSANADPNIKRVVIMLTVDYGDEESLANKESLKTAYLEVPVEQYDKQANPQNLFRVDKIIELAMPSEAEITQGITVKDKIQEAFREAEAFVSTEKLKAPDLKFEGIAHWVGHGSVHNNIVDEKKDLFYRDGSLNFTFLPNHQGEEISKDEIKDIEHERLKGFKTFIQHFMACNSGAMIS